MLHRAKVITALEDKREEFTAYVQQLGEQRLTLEESLAAFFALDRANIERQIADEEWPGARLSDEFEGAEQLCIPFSQQWHSHEEARRWALQVLQNHTVIAVDGSQLTPSKDYSIPVAAVQVGWFVNHHRSGGSYSKDVAFEVLAPTEIMGGAEEESSEDLFPTWQVNQRRFVLECEKLCQLMEEQALVAATERPLCLFDGSFIISFAGQMRGDRAIPYWKAINELLACSSQQRIPLAAFVDSSFSHDLANLIALSVQSKVHNTNIAQITDGTLMRGLLHNWGDRSPFFYCARRDALSDNRKTLGLGDFYNDVAFCYVQLTADRPPARLEIPRWVLESGYAEEIVDLVRAECVVGGGYPYAIETADALAVISQQDRERFFALFQQFVEPAGLALTQARKAQSKLLRR